MILDRGICSIFSKQNAAGPGEKPRYEYALKYQAYYGELSFETSPVFRTENREDVQTDARIRVPQDRSITNHDAVVLRDAHCLSPGEQRYEVIRAYHGNDDDNGLPVTDISLREVRP